MSRFRNIAYELHKTNLWCFPLCFRGTAGHLSKQPLVAAWKPYQTRAPYPYEYANWFKRWPWASAGIPTGPAQRLLVVDCDSPEAIAWLQAKGLPKTQAVATRRGRHYYFAWREGLEVRNSAGRIAEGVDVRGQGGCATAPGSGYLVKVEQRWELFEYRWVEGHSPADIDRAPVPDWLCEMLQRKPPSTPITNVKPWSGSITPYARRVFDLLLEELLAAGEGTRNDTLNVVAFRLGQWCGGGELPAEQVVRSLEAVARNWQGEDFAKSRTTIRRALADGMKFPKQSPRFQKAS